MKTWTGFLVVVLVLAACGSQPESVASPPNESEPSTSAPTSETIVPSMERRRASPPNLEVMAGDQALVLSPYSYCWMTDGEGVCADGAPREPLPSLTVSADSPLTIMYALDWQLTATLLSDGEYCNGERVVDVDPEGSPIEALGPAGAYRVDVFGRGEGGDGAWAFELIVDEDLEVPETYWQAFWNPSGRALDRASSFFAVIGNVETRPADVSAVASVEAADGESEAFELAASDDGGCWASTLGFDGGPDFTDRVIELGPSPYSITVIVTLDGRTITGDPLDWPTDFPDDSNESARTPIG